MRTGTDIADVYPYTYAYSLRPTKSAILRFEKNPTKECNPGSRIRPNVGPTYVILATLLASPPAATSLPSGPPFFPAATHPLFPASPRPATPRIRR
jgi:hypothetical protein